MANSIPDVRMRIVVEGDNVKAVLGPAAASVEALGRAAQTAGAQVQNISNTTNNYITNVRQAAAGTRELTNEVHDLKEALGAVVEFEVFKHITESLIEAKLQFQQINYTLQTLTGSQQGAAQEFEYVTSLANYYGLSLAEVGQQYGKLAVSAKAANISMDDTKAIFQAMSMASTNFHLSSTQQSSVFLALQEMMATGTMYMRQLKLMIGEQLPGVYEEFVKLLQKQGKDVHEMARKGALDMKEYMNTLTQAVVAVVDPKMVEEARHGLNAEMNRTKTTFLEFKNALMADNGPIMTSVIAVLRGMTTVLKSLNDSGLSNIAAWTLLTGAMVAFLQTTSAIAARAMSGVAALRAHANALAADTVTAAENTAATAANTRAQEANNIAKAAGAVMSRAEAEAKLFGTVAQVGATVEAEKGAEAFFTMGKALSATRAAGSLLFGLMGGWPGVIMLVGGALLYLASKESDAEKSTKALQESMDALRDSAGPSIDINLKIMNQHVDETKKNIDDLKRRIENLRETGHENRSTGTMEWLADTLLGTGDVEERLKGQQAEAEGKLVMAGIAANAAKMKEAREQTTQAAQSSWQKLASQEEQWNKEADQEAKKWKNKHEQLTDLRREYDVDTAQIKESFEKRRALGGANVPTQEDENALLVARARKFNEDYRTIAEREDKRNATGENKHQTALQEIARYAEEAQKKVADLQGQLIGLEESDKNLTRFTANLADYKKTLDDQLLKLDESKRRGYIKPEEWEAARRAAIGYYTSQVNGAVAVKNEQDDLAAAKKAQDQQDFMFKLVDQYAAVGGGKGGSPQEKAQAGIVAAVRQYQKDVAEAGKNFKEGTDEYAVAVNLAADTMNRSIDHAKTQASDYAQFVGDFQHRVENVVGTSLENSMDGKFNHIAKAWQELLRGMVADALKRDVSKALFGEKNEEGTMGGAFGSLLSLVGLNGPSKKSDLGHVVNQNGQTVAAPGSAAPPTSDDLMKASIAAATPKTGSATQLAGNAIGTAVKSASSGLFTGIKDFGSSVMGFFGLGGSSPVGSMSNPTTDLGGTAADVGGDWANIGLAGGGYTGPGSKYKPAGVVHAGEFVFTKEATSANRGLFESMHSASIRSPGVSLTGYASGGLVGASKQVAPLAPTQPSTVQSHQHSINLNMSEDMRKTTLGDVIDGYFAQHLRNN